MSVCPGDLEKRVQICSKPLQADGNDDLKCDKYIIAVMVLSKVNSMKNYFVCF